MADPTLNELITKTILLLNGQRSNTPKVGTLTSITLAGSTITNMVVEVVNGPNTTLGPCIMEIGNTLVYAASWDTNSGEVVVPPWGNGHYDSSPITVDPGVGTMVTIDPLYFRWSVGDALIDAINSLYPQLYGVRSQTLSSEVNAERYALNADAEELLSVKVEGYGPTNARREVRRRTLEITGSSRVLNIPPIGLSGRPIIVKYRTRPVLPASPNDDVWVWSDSRLPDSASDLPVLGAAAELALGNELAKLQVYSAEQGDRAKYVQAGSATSVSRRLKEEFDSRLAEEQQALSNANAVRPTLRYN